MSRVTRTGDTGELLLSEKELHDAAARLRPVLNSTPVVTSPDLSTRTGASVHLKLETLQPTHSFKVRGAVNALLSLPPAGRGRGVVAASQGNHGLGVAWAAARLGVGAAVYLPTDASRARVGALERLGAAVMLRGDSWDEANACAIDAAAASGRHYIHPFNDRSVMAGAGTLFMELLDQLPSVDLLVASVGGGGLLSGLISAARRLSPKTRVVGVETEGADCMARSLEAGTIVTLPAITSVARSLGARRTEPAQFEVVSRYAEGVVVVSDDETKRQVLETWRGERLLLEPAAACVLAALASGRVRVRPGERVVAVACGANVELDEVSAWMNPGLDS
jgi:threonine dehydratase